MWNSNLNENTNVFSFLHTCLQGNVSLVNYARQFVYIPQKMPKEFELNNLIIDKRILPLL